MMTEPATPDHGTGSSEYRARDRLGTNNGGVEPIQNHSRRIHERDSTKQGPRDARHRGS